MVKWRGRLTAERGKATIFCTVPEKSFGLNPCPPQHLHRRPGCLRQRLRQGCPNLQQQCAFLCRPVIRRHLPNSQHAPQRPTLRQHRHRNCPLQPCGACSRLGLPGGIRLQITNRDRLPPFCRQPGDAFSNRHHRYQLRYLWRNALRRRQRQMPRRAQQVNATGLAAKMGERGGKHIRQGTGFKGRGNGCGEHA